MESTLQEINAVVGVNGSFACMMNGKIIARAMPEAFDGSRLGALARVAAQTFNALELARQHVNDVDLVFDQHRLVLKNLRGGVLVILCARNINLPLLNMTANTAVKKLSIELSTKSATTSVSAPARAGDAEANALYLELERESQRLIDAANSTQVKLCVMDPIALWARSNNTRGRVTPPQKRQLDFLAPSDQASLVIRVFERVGYQANQRFNAFYGSRFLNFNESTRMISSMVFLDAYEMYHRVDLMSVLEQNETVMTETGLALMRLQLVEIADPGLNELYALFLEHELSAGSENNKIDATQITRLCADDWGWYRTVTMNLERLQAFAAKEPSPSEEALVVDRIKRLRQGIDGAPKSLRWQTRARIGDSVRWYETPQMPTSAARPDMAIG